MRTALYSLIQLGKLRLNSRKAARCPDVGIDLGREAFSHTTGTQCLMVDICTDGNASFCYTLTYRLRINFLIHGDDLHRFCDFSFSCLLHLCCHTKTS